MIGACKCITFLYIFNLRTHEDCCLNFRRTSVAGVGPRLQAFAAYPLKQVLPPNHSDLSQQCVLRGPRFGWNDHVHVEAMYSLPTTCAIATSDLVLAIFRHTAYRL